MSNFDELKDKIKDKATNDTSLKELSDMVYNIQTLLEKLIDLIKTRNF